MATSPTHKLRGGKLRTCILVGLRGQGRGKPGAGRRGVQQQQEKERHQEKVAGARHQRTT